MPTRRVRAALGIVGLVGVMGAAAGVAAFLVYAIADGAVATHGEKLDAVESDPAWELQPPGRRAGRTIRTCRFTQDGTRLYRSFSSPEPGADLEFYDAELRSLDWEIGAAVVGGNQLLFTKDFGDFDGNLVVSSPTNSTRVNLEAWVEPYKASSFSC